VAFAMTVAPVAPVAFGAAAPSRAEAQERPDGRMELRVGPYPKHIDERTHKAIEAGLKWLAENQNADGSWRGTENAYGGQFPVAMTALAGLAFLAHGDTPDRGVYSSNVKKALKYLLRIKPEDGMLSSSGEAQRPMYGHCFAMLFLGEVYGMESDENDARLIRQRLEEGVKLIGKAQSAKGGWFYTPLQGQQGQDEGSVTVTAVQGLRSAKNAGVPVDRTMIDRGIKYILDCQNFDGGIRYSFMHRGESRPAITAAAVATLFSAGTYDKAERELSDSERAGVRGMKRCLSYCDNVFDRNVDPPMVQGFMFYTHLYLSQAMWAAGDKHWDRYFPRIRDWLLDSSRSTRQADGSWTGDNPGPGKVYGTSVALLVLQLPYQYLPIWQR
jgi:prenyltransferase beta subunit